MNTEKLPLEELSIDELYNSESATYEVPIYQRNYAWEEDEIKVLVQDVYNAFQAKKQTYYIGTLVTFDKGDQIYEVIDGQQRLTTIFLILNALEGICPKNRLTYRARQISKDTLDNISELEKIDKKDFGIVNGKKYAAKAVEDINEKKAFTNYFKHNVHIVRYQVPKDVDLNHYFEVMNSRGEQLEMHEIVKATLGGMLTPEDLAKFASIWEACSEMNVYVQQKYPEESVFGKNLNDCPQCTFDSLPAREANNNEKSIKELIEGKIEELKEDDKNDKNDVFQPIIDFPNFLLVVLKITRMEEHDFDPINFSLDDKELINEFKNVNYNEGFVKKFTSNLLKAKYLLDNFIVHHKNSDDSPGDNPWQLQTFFKEGNKRYPKNLSDNNKLQEELVHLLSMYEVSFTPRQRKNYLFYCLLHLFDDTDYKNYLVFLQNLAKKYFYDVYLAPDNLSETNNRPKPNSFDNTILTDKKINLKIKNENPDFIGIYGDGTEISKGIQLFVFNYTDYKLWKKYSEELRGKETKANDEERKEFFKSLGCSDFGMDAFKDFYFSRTRKSLEHYYPQAKANGKDGIPTQAQINCFGNFAMIGAEVNSSGSNWNPKTKLDHYTDRKSDQISVASLKFKIMMQICADNFQQMIQGEICRNAELEWNFDDIREHQNKMLSVLDIHFNN